MNCNKSFEAPAKFVNKLCVVESAVYLMNKELYLQDLNITHFLMRGMNDSRKMDIFQYINSPNSVTC